MANELQWWHIVVPLFTGGAFGALITAVVTSYRNRIQPVGRRVDVLPLFIQLTDTLPVLRGKNSEEVSLNTTISISRGTKEYKFPNLFLVDIQVINKGNKDFEEFPFGITLDEGDHTVFVVHKSPDRHHVVSQSSVQPEAPKSEIDFSLKPFNRRDLYSFKLYVVIAEGKAEPGEIDFSSRLPIKFTDMPTMGELVAQAAESTSLVVGPFRFIISSR